MSFEFLVFPKESLWGKLMVNGQLSIVNNEKCPEGIPLGKSEK